MLQAGSADKEACFKPTADLKWHRYCCENNMVIAALVIGAGVILEICAVIRAPMGYQDETGFHIGVEQSDCNEGQPG